MAQKYYAPAACLSILTLTQRPGALTRSELIENLMRMLTMDATEERGRLTAAEAEAEIEEMSRSEYQRLRSRAEAELDSPEMQEYLDRKRIMVDDPLVVVNQEEVNVEEILDEYSLTEFAEQEMPLVEYD